MNDLAPLVPPAPLILIYKRRVQVLLVKNEKEHAWAINSRNID